jgi:hypothetical protein
MHAERCRTRRLFLPACSTLTNKINLCENRYHPVCALAVGLMEIEKYIR